MTYPQVNSRQPLACEPWVCHRCKAPGRVRSWVGYFMGVPEAGGEPAFELPALTETEHKVLAFVERAALQHRPLDENDVIADHLGFSGTGTIRGIMLRLERKGYVKIKSYQRGRSVYAVRVGKWTKPPLCVVPHWRTILDRSKDTPSLPVSRMMEFPTIIAEVNRLQRERNVDFAGAQILLMSYGVSMLGFVRAQESVAAHG